MVFVVLPRSPVSEHQLQKPTEARLTGETGKTTKTTVPAKESGCRVVSTPCYSLGVGCTGLGTHTALNARYAVRVAVPLVPEVLIKRFTGPYCGSRCTGKKTPFLEDFLTNTVHL